MISQLIDIVGERGVLVLRDMYIHKLPIKKIMARNVVTRQEVNDIIASISREMVYDARKGRYSVTSKEVLFNEYLLEKWVWKEFLQEQISLGKNTGQIAGELNIPIVTVNSYI